MIRINFACFFYFEAVVSFELIWSALNENDSISWVPILLHYVGMILKILLYKKRQHGFLWILGVGNDAAAQGLLRINSSNIGYLYVLILTQFQLLYNTQQYFRHSILLISWAMISQMILNYENMWRILLIFGECSALFCFLYFVYRGQNNQMEQKIPLEQSIKQEPQPSTKQHVLRLMPWLSDQKFLVLSDHFKCLHNQSDLNRMMESEENAVAISILLDTKCENLSTNLIRLLTENNTNILSQNYKPFPLRLEIRTILNALISDMNSYCTYYYVTDVENKNFQNIKLNFFVLSDNFIDYVIIHFETILKPSLKSIHTFPENNKFSNTQYNPSNNSKQTHETISSELLGNIFQSISHEFGTFLNCILTVASEGIENELINSQIKATYIEPTYINAKLLSYVLQNVRDFNTILLKQFALRLQEFSPFEIINEIQYLLNQQATQRNNQIFVHCPLNLLVYNDSERFKQVLYQIISNSIRFTENGVITVSIASYKDKIKVKVSDNGIGMNPAEQKKLQKLLQDNKKLLRVSHNSVGCGLGLSISNAIVLRMNGKHGIQFTSEQNRGSEFFFTISNSYQLYNDSVYVASQTFVKVLNQQFYLEQQPGSDGQRNSIEHREEETVRGQRLFSTRRWNQSTDSRNILHQPHKVQAEEDEIDSHSEESNIKIPSLQASLKSDIVKFSISSNCCNRVLIVDDEYFNIQCLQLILNRFNAHCDFTFNGQKAVKKCLQKLREPCSNCQSNGYVVYFLDLNMPIMDGFDTVKELKKMMHLNIIPKGICIANTGYADLESKQMALKAGMDFYMTKPIVVKELELFIKRKFP